MRDTHGAREQFPIRARQLDLGDAGLQRVDARGSSIRKAIEHEVPAFRQGFFRFRLDAERSAERGRARVPAFHEQQHLGAGHQRRRARSSARRPTATRACSCRSPTATTSAFAAGRRTRCASIADTPRFSAVTDKVRQVDNFGAYTAGAGTPLYTARTYPQQWWNRTAFVASRPGTWSGVFVLERDGAGYRSSSPMNLVASRDEWSAPIMAEVGPDGNVWILDWYNYIVQHNPTPPGFETGVGAAYESDLRDKKYGRIYRLKYVGDDRPAQHGAAAHSGSGEPRRAGRGAAPSDQVMAAARPAAAGRARPDSTWCRR